MTGGGIGQNCLNIIKAMLYIVTEGIIIIISQWDNGTLLSLYQKIVIYV